MSADRDTTRIVLSWLRADEQVSADRILDDVLNAVDTTPQRRPTWLAPRLPTMNRIVGIGLAAAAVVLAAFIGIQAFGGPGPGGPLESPSSPLATPPEVNEYFADYTIGRHSVTVDRIPFSFAVPARHWERFGNISINKSFAGSQGAEAIIYWTAFPDGAEADPCVPVLSPSMGPSVADFADAVASAPGTELVTGPSAVTVGGRPAMYVELNVLEDVGCDPGFFFGWDEPYVGAMWERTEVGDTIRVWIVGVDGARLFIGGAGQALPSWGLDQEIRQIVDSIQFE